MTGTAVTRQQILAFRLQRHNLAQRLSGGSLVGAAALCGIQNSPPGSALLALHARVEGVSRAELDQALLADKSLVQVWSVRAAPLIVPAQDAAIFTLGLLPDREEDLLFLIRGASEHLRRASLTATDLVNWTAAALAEVLDGRALTKDELGVELGRRLARQIPGGALELWNSRDEWGHFGEFLARFALNAVALRGAFCLVSQPGRAATFVRTDQWLGTPLAAAAGEDAAELLRRYLAAYGPSTSSHFGQWAGISPGQAQGTWRRIEHELAAVQLRSKTMWLPAADLSLLLAATLPAGVRLLPPHDPFLAVRDRTLLLPDRDLHAQLWRAAGSPGVVLYNGAIVATWQAQKTRAALHVNIRLLGELPSPARDEIEAEADAIAPLRNCSSAAVAFTT